MRFEGTSNYVATDDLKVAVNAAVQLRRPLLVKGEPGTGKTVLAHEIAEALGAPLIEWHIKSTTRAVQGLYEYDAVARLRDGQLGDERVHDIRNYIKRGKLWDAFTSPQLPGAADRRDRQGRHRIPQRPPPGARSDGVPCLRNRRDGEGGRPAGRGHHLEQREGAARRLPAPLLLPLHPLPRPRDDDARSSTSISRASRSCWSAGRSTSSTRSARCPGLKKKPSTSELLDWLKLLLHEDMPLEVLQDRDPTKAIPPLHGALLKNEQDVMLFERLAFMARRKA